MSDMDMAIEAIPICVPACPWRIRVLGMSDMDMATLACGCFIDGSMATNENLPPNVIKQLAKELKNLDETPPEGIKVGVNEDDFSIIFADIEGPAGTPYDNGVFRMKLILSHDFPHSPPKGYFLTKIFHPNIATNGEICVNTLKKDWNPSLGLRHVLIVVRCLLIEPFPESALNEQAGKMLLENYEEYARHARQIKPQFDLLSGEHGSRSAWCSILVNVFVYGNVEERVFSSGLLENGSSKHGPLSMSRSERIPPYEERVNLERIYTGIHALKPKPKSKTGAISESTTALNVDQSNNLVLSADEKNAVSGPPALLLPSSMAASATLTKGGSGQDQQTSTTETGVSGSAPTPSSTQKKEGGGGGLVKVQVDKKKMDARKKSLKRL
ncbi:hypothetical protein RHMOL_Rhmol03G0045600 [Rhododendron molle]|uniref:Uncharacterized protein n=1 Tax=Rhododendron molle TaxID=49168 RepID=A0ACC0PCT7_RHOML|nr:hypothetical protein RHMOL_Rhmol03G0045600 [Rhododendron molle]